MKGKDLRNALLQEAVQGKLVSQINSEGTADDILCELEAINKSETKKRSKSKIIFEINEDEIPFEIPSNWRWVRLFNILEIKPSNGYSPKEVKYTTDIKKLTLTATTSGYFKPEAFKYVDITKEESSSYWLKHNDLLIQRSNSRELVGTSCIYDGEDNEFIYPDLMMRMRVFENIDLKYIDYVLKAPFERKYFSENASGTSGSMPKITQDIVNNTLIPLPPLREQKRIVKAIEKCLVVINDFDKKQEALDELNDLICQKSIKAILQEAMQGKLVIQQDKEGNAESVISAIYAKKIEAINKGKVKREKPLGKLTDEELPFDIPDTWRWVRLSDACNMYTGDSINETEKKLKYTNIPEGRFYIGTKDVGFDKQINYDNGVKIPYDKTNFSVAPKDSVLLCIEGGSAGRKIAITKNDVCFGNKLCCFDSYEPELRQFIYYYLQSPMFTNTFRNNITGIIGGVSIGKLKAMPLPIPPMEEQKRIVAAIEKLLPLCEKLGV